MGQTIAIHAGKRVVRQPGGHIEGELRARLGGDWRRAIPASVAVATATLAGMARVVDVDLRAGCAVHDRNTEVGCALGVGRTRIDPWGDFSPGAGCGSSATCGHCRIRRQLLATSPFGAGSRIMRLLDANCPR